MSKFDPVSDIPDLSGKIAIVTGGNRGIGYHIIQQLANHGAKVYMASRSEASAKDAIGKMETENPEIKKDKRVVFLHLDLSTLKFAQDAAKHFLTLEDKIDILVHNGGVMNHPYAKTSDGIEDSMAVNHFAPFAFTQTLYPLLLNSAKRPESDVRVVIVSSEIHPKAPSGGKFASLEEINDPLAPPASQDGIMARYARYARSKLANILYAKQLQKEFASASSSALAIAINPGGVATDTVLDDVGSIRFVGPVVRFAISKLAKSPLDGALPALHAATSPEVRKNEKKFGGAYLASVGKVTLPSKDAQRDELAKQLWKVTERISNEILNI